VKRENPAVRWRTTLFILLAVCLRRLRSRKRKRVVLYGPKYNGNSRAFAEYLQRSGANEGYYEVVYATSDPQYYRELLDSGDSVEVLSTQKFRHMMKIGRADAIITTHDMGDIVLLQKLTNVQCINVWHGIGWKGHVPEDFLFLKDYADNWVTSPSFRRIYEQDFGIKSPVHVTGYARTDDAVNGNFSVADIRKKYGISPKFKKIILVAPTWEQNSGSHSIYPFGSTADQFFTALNEGAQKCDALVIFRTHINSGDIALPGSLKNIVFMPSNTYPVTEDFLYIADVLVSDWSSIVFDYLALERPVIFLDVPVPYELLCFSLDYRFGEIAGSLDQLTAVLEHYTKQPQLYGRKYAESIKKAVELGYGVNLDGRSAERYHRRLLELLDLR
jgi:CDP-glycerol glycerophosphotransferase (TagB/SpsB family)